MWCLAAVTSNLWALQPFYISPVFLGVPGDSVKSTPRTDPLGSYLFCSAPALSPPVTAECWDSSNIPKDTPGTATSHHMYPFLSVCVCWPVPLKPSAPNIPRNGKELALLVLSLCIVSWHPKIQWLKTKGVSFAHDSIGWQFSLELNEQLSSGLAWASFCVCGQLCVNLGCSTRLWPRLKLLGCIILMHVASRPPAGWLRLVHMSEAKVPREWAEVCKASQGLGSKLVNISYTRFIGQRKLQDEPRIKKIENRLHLLMGRAKRSCYKWQGHSRE